MYLDRYQISGIFSMTDHFVSIRVAKLRQAAIDASHNDGIDIRDSFPSKTALPETTYAILDKISEDLRAEVIVARVVIACQKPDEPVEFVPALLLEGSEEEKQKYENQTTHRLAIRTGKIKKKNND